MSEAVFLHSAVYSEDEIMELVKAEVAEATP